MSSVYKVQQFLRLDNHGKKEPFDAFYTDRLGAYMVDAESRRILNGVLGTKDEDQYYVVQYSVGDQDNYHTPIKLVFENGPQAFEDLFHVKLSDKAHAAWEFKIANMEDRR